MYKVPLSPGDPLDPRDRLGQPITTGSYICWVIGGGGLSLGRIDKIVGRAKSNTYGRSGNEVPLHQADYYTIRSRGLVSGNWSQYPHLHLYGATFEPLGFEDPYIPTITRYWRPKKWGSLSGLQYVDRVIRLDPVVVAATYEREIRAAEREHEESVRV